MLNYSKKEYWWLLDSTLMVHAWRKLSMISPLKPEKEKNQWHLLIKNNFRAPSIKKIQTLFYSNISKFAGNLEGMNDEGTYKTTIHNMHKLGWKAQFFKSADVLILGHGCGVSHYLQFYDRIKIYIKCYHVHMWGVVQVKRVTNSCTNHGILH